MAVDVKHIHIITNLHIMCNICEYTAIDDVVFRIKI